MNNIDSLTGFLDRFGGLHAAMLLSAGWHYS
jgi:hypothetical protein